MADRIITVTDPSIVTNDTLLGYNNYSDIDGQLGTTMTPTEATNGHTVALSDGVVHQVTTKPVGTTNGEFSAVVSNQVEVDLIEGDSYAVQFLAADTNYLQNDLWQAEVLQTDWSISFKLNGLIPTNALVQMFGNNTGSTVDNMMICEVMATTGNIRFRVRESGSGASTITTEIARPVDGDIITVERVTNTFNLYKNKGLGGEVLENFTISTTWSNPTTITGELIIGNSLNSVGATADFSITDLIVRGETFLPTDSNASATLTSTPSADTISVNTIGTLADSFVLL